mgnify:CR=1 FL=1
MFVNGSPIQRARDWNWISSNNELKLKRNAASVGDKITLSVYKNANYTIENNNITFLNSYPSFTVIDVTTFNNHDILDIRRFNDQISFDSTLSEGVVDYRKYTQLSSGRITLEKQSIAPQYVWIAVDGELLVPDVDYVLENNLKYISCLLYTSDAADE